MGRFQFKAPNNAQEIQENFIPGVNRVVELEIIAAGKSVFQYINFKLTQSVSKHHEFELIIPYDALENKQNYRLEDANKFLGKRLTVMMKYKDFDSKENPTNTFVGVITKVAFSQDANSLGTIVLKGFSPTILFDGAPHIQSFGGDLHVNTGIIAEDIFKQAINVNRDDYDTRIEVHAHSTFDFSVQYNETHYNYLCRLAEAHGEQFFYDGYFIHYGRMPVPNKIIELKYGSHITDVDVELRAIHTKPRFYDYNAEKNTELTSGETPLRHISELGGIAYKNNESIFRTEAIQINPFKASTDMDVVFSQSNAWGSKGVDVMHVSGKISVPFMYPSCVADLYMRETDESNKTGYFTKVMMIETTHEVDGRGHYKGTFKAIAADTGFLPRPEFTIPKADPQLATVISNTDPLGQGRVKVKFPWQNEADNTDFIRVMSPDAGGTNAVTQNRGYVAIPEVGDQVMVGFEHNHPDRPFVMGGMFHGKTALGGGAQNHMRSIQTKSGIKVLMNDNEKSITILDPSGNTWFMDGQGSITVTAPKNFTVNAGENISMNAGTNINSVAGANVSTTAGINISHSANLNYTTTAGGAMMHNAVLNYSLMAANITEIAQGEKKSRAKSMKENAQDKDVAINGNNNWHTENEFNNNTGEKSKSH